MKDEWRFVSLISGKQFVITTGERVKQELCVDNLDIQPKVSIFIDNIDYT